MKRYAEKGFCTVLLLLCMLSAALYRPVTANAKDAADKTVYAAFGDSIAAGYGLDGYSHKQTFRQLFTDKLRQLRCQRQRQQ